MNNYRWDIQFRFLVFMVTNANQVNETHKSVTAIFSLVNILNPTLVNVIQRNLFLLVIEKEKPKTKVDIDDMGLVPPT